MAKPTILVCDTDALSQFLRVGEIRPLRLLRAKYSVQLVVVPEVEIELRSGKFGAEIAPELTRALANNVLRVLDRSLLESFYGGPPSGSMAATAALNQIARTGAEYLKRVDLGEAHTHAAAVVLGMPAMSNDKNALDVLVSAGLAVPTTVLRSFDLLVLSYQTKVVSEADCDDFRRQLLAQGEGVPRCFTHKSFVDGLKEFTPRIRDASVPPVGGNKHSDLPYAGLVEL